MQPPHPREPFLAQLLRANLHSLMSDQVPAPEVAGGLEALVRRCPDDETAAFRTQWDRTMARAQPKPKAPPKPHATAKPHPYGPQQTGLSVVRVRGALYGQALVTRPTDGPPPCAVGVSLSFPFVSMVTRAGARVITDNFGLPPAKALRRDQDRRSVRAGWSTVS